MSRLLSKNSTVLDFSDDLSDIVLFKKKEDVSDIHLSVNRGIVLLFLILLNSFIILICHLRLSSSQRMVFPSARDF